MKHRPNVRKYKQWHKKNLSADAKVIIALRRKQPQTKAELCKNAGISKSAFYYVRPVLMNRGIVKEKDNGYALSDYDPIDRKVEAALNEFKENDFVEVALIDIANKVGAPVDRIEGPSFRYAANYGLKISHESKQKDAEPYVAVVPRD